MSVASIEQQWPTTPEWEEYSQALKKATRLSEMVVIVLQLGLMISRQILENELERRAKLNSPWPLCGQCGKRLTSKGWEPRQIQTIVGRIH